jgi:glycosyltransferase involved in cell wall biosynthesis
MKRNTPSVLVIVPAYNEVGNLPALLSELCSLPQGWEVLVVDDGSTDHTQETIAPLATGRIRLLSLPCNLGVGGAIQTGLKFAVRRGYDVAVQVDGDGQHPPAEISKLVEALSETGSDMVIGSRFLGGEKGFRSTVSRRLGIWIFSRTLSVLCGKRITDATSGFRAWNRAAMQLLAADYPEDYPEVEAVLILHRGGLRITEVPVRMAARTAGHSTIGAVGALEFMVKVPLAILMNLIRKPRSRSTA